MNKRTKHQILGDERAAAKKIARERALEREKAGPSRRAPEFYAGEWYGSHRIQYPDVERYPNGAIPGKRNKHMRRLIRGALKRRYSRVEQALKLPRALLAQAVEIAKEKKLSMRWARRVFAQELALHQPVYAPDQKELRRMRTEKRQLKRKGEKDAIAKLVDRMSEQR